MKVVPTKDFPHDLPMLSNGRARPPGGPVDAEPACASRVNLNHTTPTWVGTCPTFFITGCCAVRGKNSLCLTSTGTALLNAANFYHDRGDWFIRLFVLMPDHFHALVTPAPDKGLSRLLGDWKRFTATKSGVCWQKNFIDHRLRSPESVEQKADYIRQNPIRAGLMQAGETWRYLIEH